MNRREFCFGTIGVLAAGAALHRSRLVQSDRLPCVELRLNGKITERFEILWASTGWGERQRIDLIDRTPLAGPYTTPCPWPGVVWLSPVKFGDLIELSSDDFVTISWHCRVGSHGTHDGIKWEIFGSEYHEELPANFFGRTVRV